jgi:hypothetical protein
MMLVFQGPYIGHYARRIYHIEYKDGSVDVQAALIDELAQGDDMVIDQVLLKPGDLCLSYVRGDNKAERSINEEHQKSAIRLLQVEARKTRAR